MKVSTPSDVMDCLLAARRDRDVDAALVCYEPTATFVSEPGKSSAGSEALAAFIKGTMDLPISFSGRIFVEAGDLALHVAEWTIAPANFASGERAITGRTADVLRKQHDGSWLIAIDNPWGTTVLRARTSAP